MRFMGRPSSRTVDARSWTSLAVRSRRSRWLVLLATLAGTAIAVPALIRLSGHAPAPLPIALVLPLSGARAAECAPMVNAMMLKVDEMNRAGGIDGRPIQLLKYDDQGEATVARRVAREVAAGPALAVIGHLSNGTTAAASGIYRDAGLLAVSGTATADHLTVDNP